MVWRVSEPAGATEVPTGAGYIRENNAQVEAVLSASRLNAGTAIPDIFATGGVVKAWFYLNAAPTNWTLVAGLGDTLLAVKGGTTYTAGAATAGTWQQPSATLTVDQIPDHSHGSNATVSANSGSGGVFYAYNASNKQTETTLTAGAAASAHNHGLAYRPAARVGVICSKD